MMVGLFHIFKTGDDALVAHFCAIPITDGRLPLRLLFITEYQEVPSPTLLKAFAALSQWLRVSHFLLWGDSTGI